MIGKIRHDGASTSTFPEMLASKLSQKGSRISNRITLIHITANTHTPWAAPISTNEGAVLLEEEGISVAALMDLTDDTKQAYRQRPPHQHHRMNPQTHTTT